ncbi:MAG: Nitrilase [Gemmatimonadaceae bacterium]|nr:Nitrilase [Gemmatimonadaceae bacterium]
MPTVRVAVVQGETGFGSSRALDLTRSLAADAAARGAMLIAFPETWLPGYPIWLDVCRDVALWDHNPTKQLFRRYAEASVDVGGPTGTALADLARELGVTLVIGVSERVERGPGNLTLYNSLLTFGPDGRLLNHHRKLMPTFSERMLWGQGDANGVRAVETPAGRVGGLICWEHWMPMPRQALHDSGTQIHVAAWPTAHERNQIASRHIAFEGRCFVLVAASVMRASALPTEVTPHPEIVTSPDQWVLRGGSAIVGPDGFYLEEPLFDGPGTLVADLELGRIREESMTLDTSGHYSRPDCFEFTVLERPRGDRRTTVGLDAPT